MTEARICHSEKMGSSTVIFGKLDSYMKKNEFKMFSNTMHKNKFKMAEDLNVGMDTVKLLEENIRQNTLRHISQQDIFSIHSLELSNF